MGSGNKWIVLCSTRRVWRTVLGMDEEGLYRVMVVRETVRSAIPCWRAPYLISHCKARSLWGGIILMWWVTLESLCWAISSIDEVFQIKTFYDPFYSKGSVCALPVCPRQACVRSLSSEYTIFALTISFSYHSRLYSRAIIPWGSVENDILTRISRWSKCAQ